ncbi:MAG: hypothetical protein ACKVP5_23220 [Aestuariivirga sp.]
MVGFKASAKQIKLGLPLRSLSLFPQETDKPPGPDKPLPPDTVVVGIIDDGIAFAHERFRFADGTSRVHYFWQQDGVVESPSTVRFGREIWKPDFEPRSGINNLRKGIDSLLCEFGASGIVDEEGLYRAAKLVDFSTPGHKAASLRLAHGTHVLDVAAGAWPNEALPNIAIIAVQLPVSVMEDTSGAGLDIYVGAAVEYIVDRADRLAGTGSKFPIVINCSLGTFAGPHDGTYPIESYMDKIIQDRPKPVSIVLPSGNGHLSRCHALVEFEKIDEEKILSWRIQPGDRTLTQMEIWLPFKSAEPPKRGESRIEVVLETPDGSMQAALLEEFGSAPVVMRDPYTGGVFAEMSYVFAFAPTNRGCFAITVQPTEVLQPVTFGRSIAGSTSVAAPSGAWKVIIRNKGLSEEQAVEAWIQRDDDIYGYRPRARQSYFEDKCYLRFDPITGDIVTRDHEEDASVPASVVKRRGMISAMATGTKPVVVGGIREKEHATAHYSAGGPSASRAGPEAAAISDDSRIHAGVLAAGSRSGSAVIMDGTSVAAPMITREIAKMMLAGGKGDRSEVQALADSEETRNPAWPKLDHEIYYGKGRITARDRSRPRRIDPDM